MNRLPRILIALTAATSFAAAAEVLFTENFSGAEAGSMPDAFLVLDGQFAVKADGDNQFVELPGAPLESYGFLFGPSEAAGVEIRARIHGERTGRKYPTFAVGLNGASGYRLQVAPAKDAVELLKGDLVVASAPFKWSSGQWTEFRLATRKAGGELAVEGRVWPAGQPEPQAPLVTFTDPKPQPAGKAGAWGMPFSGKPIRFDDFVVTRIN